jgi:hypothetical protein
MASQHGTPGASGFDKSQSTRCRLLAPARAHRHRAGGSLATRRIRHARRIGAAVRTPATHWRPRDLHPATATRWTISRPSSWAPAHGSRATATGSPPSSMRKSRPSSRPVWSTTCHPLLHLVRARWSACISRTRPAPGNMTMRRTAGHGYRSRKRLRRGLNSFRSFHDAPTPHIF